MTVFMDRFEESLALFRDAPDPDYRADLLIEYASRYRAPDASLHPRPYPESHKVPGCEVYVFSDRQSDGSLCFSFGVENPQGVSAKALAVFLQETLSGASLDDIRQVRPDFVHTLFGRMLSMGKGQGLMNMVMVVQHLAALSPTETTDD